MSSQVLSNRWNSFEELDRELKDEIGQIIQNPKTIEDHFYRELEFGTAGMRGLLGVGTNRMNIYTVRKAAEGLALYMDSLGEAVKQRGVVIAYDNRHKSDVFALEVARTVGRHGIKVYLFDALRPTPELSFAIRYLYAFAGVMITASHNPAEYNGFKLYGEDGGQITPEAATEIIEQMNTISDCLQIKVASEEELLEQDILTYIGEKIDQAYLKQLQTIQLDNNMDKKVNIVYSPLHGTGNKLVRDGLNMLGYKNVTVVQEQSEPDPDFSTVKSPNPEEQEAFSLSIEYGKRTGADLLMATDPDADRIGIAVKNHIGQYKVLSGNQIGALLVHYILLKKKQNGTLPENGMVLKSIVTSEMGSVIAKDFGVRTLNTLTGFKYISEKIAEYEKTNEYTYLFGYEESYGYLYGTFSRDKDAVQTALLLAEMADFYKQYEKSIYQVLNELYETYGYFRESVQSITLKGKEGTEIIRNIMSVFRSGSSIENEKWKIVKVEDYQSGKGENLQTGLEYELNLPQSDVLKYFYGDGSWFCIRPSGTEPKIKFYFGVNSETKESSENKLHELSRMVMDKVEEIMSVKMS